MNPDTIVNMLEPLRAPGAISWWPPAPGWWILGLLLLALLALLMRWLWRLYRRGAPLRAARAELARIEQTQLNNATRAEALAQLQRRIAIALAGRTACAGLTGSAWSDFLNRLARDDEQYIQPAMTELAYRDRVSSEDCAAVLEATRRWLGALERPR